jgi:hypothetical protein
MKPTIGRIVIYHLDEEQAEKINNYQSQAPAIITSVHGELVNLKVLLDGENNLWATSRQEGTEEGKWSWPVIED